MVPRPRSRANPRLRVIERCSGPRLHQATAGHAKPQPPAAPARSKSLRLEDHALQFSSPSPGEQMRLPLACLFPGLFHGVLRDLPHVLPHSIPRGAPGIPEIPCTLGIPGPPVTTHPEPEHPDSETPRARARSPDADHSAGDDHRTRSTDRLPDRPGPRAAAGTASTPARPPRPPPDPPPTPERADPPRARRPAGRRSARARARRSAPTTPARPWSAPRATPRSRRVGGRVDVQETPRQLGARGSAAGLRTTRSVDAEADGRDVVN